ncbi:class I SAM-dependent methyltransferase [Arenimonas fontis]|uniref:Class I SAM-dependent methyltransferase n=1 Tax=Arenimonas fontis TaxID=2608255 RepID=A0A5B2ZAB2_9GAMM|nr:class I SAM-dependent methyltransferase [Arenimonas fontis]KAA2284092.1 class I SAM-dependent methyltransferase [Arenimonas fontis]
MRTVVVPLALALAVALSACRQADAPEAPAAEPAAGTADSTGSERRPSADRLDAVLAGDWRDPANTARDVWRHPRETLEFFGVGPSQAILEITPGGGWYTEILAPLPEGKGRYVGAIVDPEAVESEGARNYYARSNQGLRDKLAARPDVYGDVSLIEFDPKAPVFGEPGSMDVVLTFRNVHNWADGGYAEAMFAAFFEVLAPGGVLGVVEHRAAEGKTWDEVKGSGYVPEDYVISLATAAGFVLEEKSEINANPADTKDHPKGVWMLPPSNRHDESEREKYAAIGESDRMTLRFVKPAGSASAD